MCVCVVLPFWYRLTQVVLEKRPLNGCVCVCVLHVSDVSWSVCLSDMEVGHWVTGSMGHLGRLSRPGHQVTGSAF